MPTRSDLRKVLVIGSGPIIIGQAAEFDYSGSQACLSLREEGVHVVLVNSNPATIQTDLDIADTVYVEPLTLEILAAILRKERPDGLLPTMGGQTGLNLAVELQATGVLDELGVEVIGTSVASIRRAEDRKLFNELLTAIGEPFARSVQVTDADHALGAVPSLGGYPILCRPSYALGGTGSGVAFNDQELVNAVSRALAASLNRIVTLDQCVLGWKEIEYEVMRDGTDSCVAVCNMENFDPMGVHTGDSIVVAPAQTLTDDHHQTLRSAAFRVIRALKIAGGCNIQFAVNPKTFEYLVVEVNPRVSRSSALASKATGYPIARVAAKIALGMHLYEIPNKVTGTTPASFEPALDYVVVKIPRWPFDKLTEVDRHIGTQMKSTGEVMGIGRTFEEAIQKAIRSLDLDPSYLTRVQLSDGKSALRQELSRATDSRLFQICEALRIGIPPEEINQLTGIDPWFLHKLQNIVATTERIRSAAQASTLPGTLLDAKKLGFSDLQISSAAGVREQDIRALRRQHGVRAGFNMVDTCAAEFDARTPYYYSTYESPFPHVPSRRRKILILGSGPIRIGQGIEFDYCCVHAARAAREEGVEALILNNNPETVSTDYDVSDRLYFEPLTFEDVMNVIETEAPDAVVVQFGGQTSINLALPLAAAGVPILGTSAEGIDIAEDRARFHGLLQRLGIPQPLGATAMSTAEARSIARELGYPVLVRPSYVLGGRAMVLVHDEAELEGYMAEAVKVSAQRPVLIDKYLESAIEVDVDAVVDGQDVFIGGILEHIEMAGVHSGDAAMVLPPQTIPDRALALIREYTQRLASELHIRGLMNIQFAVKNGTVFVLEVNPRASRTIPFTSKATGIPLAKVATRVLLGRSLKELGLTGEAHINYVAVKESVFPFVKLPGADAILGPEMKSTGEVMGLDADFPRAYYKAQLAAGNTPPRDGAAFISISRRESAQEVVEIGGRMKALGFELLATQGTSLVLAQAGIDARPVKKVSEGAPNIIDHIQNGRVNIIVNTPTVGRNPMRDGYKIRRTAIDYRVPYTSTLPAARAMLHAIPAARKGRISVTPLNEYYNRAPALPPVSSTV